MVDRKNVKVFVCVCVCVFGEGGGQRREEYRKWTEWELNVTD